MISNLFTGDLAIRRATLAHELSLLVPVHSNYALNGIDTPSSQVVYHDVTDKLEFISRYTHHLCFENNSRPGYITEKPFDALWVGSVPLYEGDPLIREWISGAAFLDCSGLDAAEIARKIQADIGIQALVDGKREGWCLTSYAEMNNQIENFGASILLEKSTEEKTSSESCSKHGKNS